MRIYKDAIGVGLLSLFFLFNQFVWIPIEVMEEGSSDTYPYLLNGLLALFLICYIGEFVYRLKSGKSMEYFTLEWRPISKIALLLIAMFLWAESMEYVGFLLPTIVFLALASTVYGERSIPKRLILSLCAPIFVVILFALLNTALPQGAVDQWILQFMPK